MLSEKAGKLDSVGIEDVQGSADSRNIPIDKVGVKALRHPIAFSDRSGVQHTVAQIDMSVSLSPEFKGTHMSRFIDILNSQTSAISIDSFRALLETMRDRLEATSGMIEMSFPWFVNKSAPVSGVKSMVDYEVCLIGRITGDVITTSTRVIVPVTSLCPCSKKISEYGAHNQRSHVTVEVTAERSVLVEELIDMVEGLASAELYGMLKRVDEKFVTERAYDNPKFVEDMVRDVAVALNDDDRVESYRVEVENFESIHNHSAYAQISCDKT
ncbi:MAG: GTP cyclohydrolase I FolE2 [Acidiferrobacterales bacterium]|nr:GTP cyclohydrolase I FolE2 [Acidiferrobacterales bacterium]